MAMAPAEKQISSKQKLEQEASISPKISAFISAFLEKNKIAGSKALRLRTEGAKRIRIELKKAEPWVRNAYVEAYNELVLGIISILTDPKSSPNQELRDYLDRIGKGKKLTKTEEKCMEALFITEIWGVMNSNLGIKYETNEFEFMSESMRTGKFDCNSSVFLVYDVAKKLGVKMDMIVIPPRKEEEGHVLVKTRHFLFDITRGWYLPLKELTRCYPVRRVLNEKQIQSISHNNRGAVYTKLGDYEQALKSYDEAIRIDRRDSEAHNNRGAAYYGLKSYEQAVKDFNKAIRLNPESTDAYYNRGNAHYYLKNYRRAVKDFNEAIRLNPEMAEAYYNRGDTHYKLKNYKRAVKDYDGAIRLNPEFSEAYYSRGNAHYRLNKYRRAVKDYTRVLEMKPELADVYFNRGSSCYRLKDYKMAVKDFTKIIEMNLEYVDAYFDRALAYEKMGKMELAKKDRKKYLQLAKK